MITAIIPMRNRSIQRLDRCVKSIINQPLIKKILVIDYGSKKPVEYKRKNVEVIRFPLKNNKYFNKAHALNIGFKLAKTDYVCTIDVDMIIHPHFMKEVKRYLDEKSFFYCRRVRRLECKYIKPGTTFKDWSRKATSWTSSGGARVYKDDLRHFATGGIQIFPTKWIKEINGIDENLVGLGGMDNFTVEMAYETGLNLIVINKKILHQEHQKKKEEQFAEDQRKFLEMVRVQRRNYLLTSTYKKEYNKRYWGSLKKPNQPLIERQWKNYEKERFAYQIEVLPKNLQKIAKLINQKNITKKELMRQIKKLTKKNKVKVIWPKKTKKK